VSLALERLHDSLAGHLPWRRTRDDEGSPRQVEFGHRVDGLVEHPVPDHHVPREPNPRRLLEHTSPFLWKHIVREGLSVGPFENSVSTTVPTSCRDG